MLHHGHGHGQLTISIFDMIQVSLQTTPQVTATNTKNIDRQGSVIKLYKRNILPSQNIYIYIYIYINVSLVIPCFHKLQKLNSSLVPSKLLFPWSCSLPPNQTSERPLIISGGRFGITDQNRMESKKCYGFYIVCIDRGCFPLIWGQ